MDIQAFLYQQKFVAANKGDFNMIQDRAKQRAAQNFDTYSRVFKQSICHGERLESDWSLQRPGRDKLRQAEQQNKYRRIGFRRGWASTLEMQDLKLAEANFKFLSVLGCPLSGVYDGWGVDGSNPPAMTRFIVFIEQFDGDEKHEYEKIVKKYVMRERSVLNPMRYTSLDKYYFDLSTEAIYTTTSKLISAYMKNNFSIVDKSRKELFKSYFEDPSSLPLSKDANGIRLLKVPFTMYRVNIRHTKSKKRYTVFYITYEMNDVPHSHPVAVVDSERLETSQHTYRCVIDAGQYTCKIFEYYNQIAFGPFRVARRSKDESNSKRYVFIGKYTSGMYPTLY